MMSVLERNILRMKDAGASEIEIDRFARAKGMHRKIPRVWRLPLGTSGTASASEVADLTARYGLEADNAGV